MKEIKTNDVFLRLMKIQNYQNDMNIAEEKINKPLKPLNKKKELKIKRKHFI